MASDLLPESNNCFFSGLLGIKCNVYTPHNIRGHLILFSSHISYLYKHVHCGHVYTHAVDSVLLNDKKVYSINNSEHMHQSDVFVLLNLIRRVCEPFDYNKHSLRHVKLARSSYINYAKALRRQKISLNILCA